MRYSAEIAALTGDAQRLKELKAFLAVGTNSGNRTRIAEIDEQLKRIEKRLTEIDELIRMSR